jgi:hypothetical protein
MYISGTGELLSLGERVHAIWDLQKRVAELLEIYEWGPDFKRRMNIYDESILPVIERAVKSIVNVKSVKPLRYNKISLDWKYETGSSVNFNYKKIFITHWLGGVPDKRTGCGNSASVSIYDENFSGAPKQVELFKLLIHLYKANSAKLVDNNYNALFKGKGDIDMGTYIKAFPYQWTGILTFLPNDLLKEIDLTNYKTTVIENLGVIVSMEEETDTRVIFDFNRKIAFLNGWDIENKIKLQ